MNTFNLIISQMAFIYTCFFRDRKISKRFNQFSQKKLEKSLKKMKKTGSIKPVDSLNIGEFSQFYKKYYLKRKPVILKGMLDHTSALQDWNIDYFLNKIPNLRIKIDVRERSSDKYPERELKTTTLKEFVNLSKEIKTHTHYLKFSTLLDQFSELKKQIGLSDICRIAKIKKNRKIYTKFFLDPTGGASTNLHMTPDSNLYIQIEGTKKWYLYHSKNNSYLISPYEKIPNQFPYFRSQYVYNPEYYYKYIEKFPLFSYLEGFSTEINQGDVLYIPPFTWHYVKSLSPTISLANWWYDLPLAFKADPFYFLLSLYSLSKVGLNLYNIDNAKEEFEANDYLDIFNESH